MAVSGVRSSWLTLATNSVRTRSRRRSAVTSWSTMTAPASPAPSGSGTALISSMRATGWPSRSSRRNGASCPPGARRAEQLVQLRAADHLRQRLALAAARPHPEHRPRALVHEHDALVPVHRDHALHHAVQDRRGLGARLLRVVDLLAQPRHHDVERAAQRAQLVHRTDGGPRAGLALAHTPGDLLH